MIKIMCVHTMQLVGILVRRTGPSICMCTVRSTTSGSPVDCPREQSEGNPNPSAIFNKITVSSSPNHISIAHRQTAADLTRMKQATVGLYHCFSVRKSVTHTAIHCDSEESAESGSELGVPAQRLRPHLQSMHLHFGSHFVACDWKLWGNVSACIVDAIF